jgi:hypothetical protein
MAELFADLQERGGPKALRELQAAFAPEAPSESEAAPAAEAVAAVKADPLNGYDTQSLIKCGVVAWTYADMPCTADSFVLLDAEAERWMAEQVLRLNKPDLFDEAAQVKG